MVYVAAVQTGWQMLEGFDLCVHQDLLMSEELPKQPKDERKSRAVRSKVPGPASHRH